MCFVRKNNFVKIYYVSIKSADQRSYVYIANHDVNFFFFQVKCSELECSEHTDCAETLACFSGHCVDPCKIDNVCGSNTECFSTKHDAVCSCKPGTTGDPHLGCVQLQYCSTNSQCQAGTICHNGICLCA